MGKDVPRTRHDKMDGSTQEHRKNDEVPYGRKKLGERRDSDCGSNARIKQTKGKEFSGG
jgi:hypothetical protein